MSAIGRVVAYKGWSLEGFHCIAEFLYLVFFNKNNVAI